MNHQGPPSCRSADQAGVSWLLGEGGGRLRQAGIGRGEIGHHRLFFLLLLDRQKLVLPIDHKIQFVQPHVQKGGLFLYVDRACSLVFLDVP